MKRVLLILLALSLASCHKAGDRYLYCECIKDHTESTIIMLPDARGAMQLTPTLITVCDESVCDSVYVDSSNKHIKF